MHSMTGYGQHCLSEDGRELTIECKSVNHRYLDTHFRLPRGWLFMEDAVRKMIARYIQRGHIDIFFTYQNMREDARAISVDMSLAEAYEKALLALASFPQVRDDRSIALLASFPNVINVEEAEEDKDAVSGLCLRTLEGALQSLVQMRAQEGEAMQADLSARLSMLEDITGQIEGRAPLVTEEYRQKLQERLAALLETIPEPQRVAQEVALFAEHAAIDEELIRLRSHIKQFRQGLESTEPIGRKLDFLTQELGREMNTIGAKATDLAIASWVVEAKAVIEKLREQIQNVE